MGGRCDVAVVGAGLLGVYTAWRIALAGGTVVVLDQGIPGDQSTGRSSGGLRRQFASAYEISLSVASRAFYERLESDEDFPGGIERVGYLFLAGPDQRDVLAESYALQRAHGVPVEWLDAEQIRGVAPYCDPSDVVAGTLTADDGFVNPWDVHQWVCRRARSLGATIRPHCRVGSIVRDGTAWRVSGDGFAVRAGQVVLAAGAWTGDLAATLGAGVPVSPSPRVKVLTDRHPQLPADMPLITDLTTGAYVRSEHGHALVGAKPRVPQSGFVVDTALDRLAEIMERAAVRFPSLADAGIAGAVSGLYETTPDGLPVAGPVAGSPGLYVIAGFNGHGIMHGPAVADALCAQVTGSAGTLDISVLAPARFGRPTSAVVTLL